MGLLVTQMPSQHQDMFIHPVPKHMPALTFAVPRLLCKALVLLVMKELLSFPELLSSGIEAVTKPYLLYVSM